VDKVAEQLRQQLASADFKCAFIATNHLSELRSDFEKLLDQGILKRDFYDEIVARLGLDWHFEPPASIGTVRSVIITAVPQPKTSLKFEVHGKEYYAIVPPTYIYDTDEVALNIMAPLLAAHGYTIHDALLPAKLLAAHSGLVRYGRNNITYIEGWGSYFRLRAFFSDLPCSQDSWQEPAAMELCSKCTACIKRCPTGAISADRFLADAGRCVTFFNEGTKEFPEWIDPEWHNCLVGCMICQDICPANKEHVTWVIPGGDFSEEETAMILDGVPKDKIPANTVKKLEEVGMLEYYELLKRNLGALFNKSQKGTGKGDQRDDPGHQNRR
jgi:epoxyqueuosine reductase